MNMMKGEEEKRRNEQVLVHGQLTARASSSSASLSTTGSSVSDDQAIPTAFSATTTRTASTMNRDHYLRQHPQVQDEIIILPPDWKPGNRDVLCGRARDNFHHDGNKYFRQLIQQNIGPYIGATTKMEKGEAILKIVQVINESSPMGGFVKKDTKSGRWFRIKDSEAKDKVGHAIRKAVQRLEETKPKLAARLRREYASSTAPSSTSSTPTTGTTTMDTSRSIHSIGSTSASTSESMSSSSLYNVHGSESTEKIHDARSVKTSASLKSPPKARTSTSSSAIASSLQSQAGRIESDSAATTSKDLSTIINSINRFGGRGFETSYLEAVNPNMGSYVHDVRGQMPTLSTNYPLSSTSTTAVGQLGTVPPSISSYQGTDISSLLRSRLAPQSATTVGAAAAAATAATTGSIDGSSRSILSSYQRLLQLQLQEQRSKDDLLLIQAAQRQREASLRREIEVTARQRAIEQLTQSAVGILGGTNLLPSSLLQHGSVSTGSLSSSLSAPLGLAGAGTGTLSGTGSGRLATGSVTSPLVLQHLLSRTRSLSPTSRAIAEDQIRKILSEGDNSTNLNLEGPGTGGGRNGRS